MKKSILGAGLILFLSSIGFAQQTLLGAYSGTFAAPSFSGGTLVHVGLTLELTSLEDGTVKGKAVRMGTSSCAGEYPVQGTVKGNELELRSTARSGRASDCRTGFKLTVEGNKLTGTMNGMIAQLSK